MAWLSPFTHNKSVDKPLITLGLGTGRRIISTMSEKMKRSQRENTSSGCRIPVSPTSGALA